MSRDAAAFLRYGRAEKDVNLFDYSASLGVRGRGMVSGRVDDFLGFAVTHSHASEKLRLAQAATGIVIPGHETAVEVTYRAQVQSWLAIQPTLQRIFNPGLSPDIRHATVIGVRLEIAL
jgi:porin